MNYPRWILLPAFAVAAFALSPAARAQTSYPMVSRVEPAAIQRGSTAEITITGTGNFAGAWQLLCEPNGLTGEVPSAADSPTAAARNSARARLTAASDAPLGPREIRVATPQGVSTVGLVVVVDQPVVAEADDKANDLPAQAQPLSLPAVATGAIARTEDVDWYSVEASAGQQITFRVWGNRLENKIHDLQKHFDPILVLHDGNGRELAANDNHDFADPVLTHEFREAGRYFLEIRDTTYAGNASWTYVVEATGGPYVTSVFPLGVQGGSTAVLHARGPHLDPGETIRLEVPATLPRGPWLTSLNTPHGPTLAVPLVVSPLPLVLEENDAADEFAAAPPVSLPAAVCGRLGSANDRDLYRFEARKGAIYALEITARRAGAATDATLRVLNDKGAILAEADDTFGKDPRLEWTAPADGTFAAQVSDLHSRGGDEFGYVLEAAVARPDFVLTCDPDKLNVGPGGRVPVFVQVTRRGGFGGPVAIEWDSLPPGLSSSPLTIPASMTEGVLVVAAAPDAPRSAALLSLKGKGETPEGPVVQHATPKQEIYMPGGGRGMYPVSTLALAVTSPSDILVEATQKTITLKPGGTATIDVTVTRRKDFDKGVNLAVVLEHLSRAYGNPLPPGVTLDPKSKTLLSPKETTGKIILKAAPNAASCENVPIAIMGHVSINFVVKTAYASEPVLVSVQGK